QHQRLHRSRRTGRALSRRAPGVRPHGFALQNLPDSHPTRGARATLHSLLSQLPAVTDYRRRMNAEEAKRAAAHAALRYLPEAGVIGLGCGSTARYFIEFVAELVRGGRQLVGVPSSEQSRRLALQLGIQLLSDTGPWSISVSVDGADEVSKDLDLI